MYFKVLVVWLKMVFGVWGGVFSSAIDLETVTLSKHEKCKLKKIVVTPFTPFDRTTVILVF